MNRPLYHKRNHGFALVEVLIAIAIVSASIFSFSEVASRSVELTRESVRRTQAAFLLEEGLEALRSIRDSQWSGISNPMTNTNYYLSYSSGWNLSTTPNTIDRFTRTVVFSTVNRDGADDITASGGTLDDRTRKATVSVSWLDNKNNTQTKAIQIYLTDIFTN